ncbi:MAG TPA: class II aldolase/adducin family protein [Xanthobacteraceae bacterium]|nr:class II aldolase/adducin family protein [Xanthobacteraceae bacterium]
MEQRLRHEIAAVTLLLVHERILGYSGHVSARLPDRNAILIQPIHQSRAGLRPDHLLACDMDGRMIDGPKGERPPSEIFIHTEIYKARPDINAIAHYHHDLTTTFSFVEGVQLRPIKNHAVRWASGIPIHPDPDHVNTAEQGRALAKTLGQNHALIIRAHGEVVVAETLPSLLMDCVHFTENAEALYHASLLGRAVPLNADELSRFSRSLQRPKHAIKLWAYYVGRALADGIIPKAWSQHLGVEGSNS